MVILGCMNVEWPGKSFYAKIAVNYKGQEGINARI